MLRGRRSEWVKEATGSNHRTSAKSWWPQQDRRGLPEEAKRRHLTTDFSFIASHSPASFSLRKPQAVSWHICPSLTGLHQWETLESRTASWAFMAMPECQYKCNNFTDKFTDLKTLCGLLWTMFAAADGFIIQRYFTWVFSILRSFGRLLHYIYEGNVVTLEPIYLRETCSS